MNKTFDILLLLARPAAGKSEIIDHLGNTPLDERIQRYHIGDFDVIDDFPLLWTWFEEDDILTKLGHSRLHTDKKGFFKWDYLWDVLIERINLEYKKKIAETPDYHHQKTTIIEFARGTEHGGFSRAFNFLDKAILNRSVILFINVSWQESQRKNKARFNPNRPYSILEHGLTDEKLNVLYRHIDWDDLTSKNDPYIDVKGVSIPYSVFKNEDDVTTKRGKLLTNRLKKVTEKLWFLHTKREHTLNNP